MIINGSLLRKQIAMIHKRNEYVPIFRHKHFIMYFKNRGLACGIEESPVSFSDIITIQFGNRYCKQLYLFGNSLWEGYRICNRLHKKILLDIKTNVLS